MKKLLLLVTMLIGYQMQRADAAITVTPASGGTNICANLAVGGATPGWTSLGTITVSENNNNDISTGFPRTLVITAPAGWQFNTAAAPTLNFTAGRNIIFVNSGGFSATALTINVFINNTNQQDAITIAGLQVRATSTTSAAGNIRATTFTGFNGINAGTNFGSLSLSPILTPSVGIAATPSASICPGTTVTFTATPVNGGTPTWQWQLNGTAVTGATTTTFTSGTLVDGDNVSVIMGATGCVTPTFATNNVIVTVNPLPPAVPVTGAGTFCETATITAGPAAGGTIYYQGTNINGTSTATPSTSEAVTNAGSYTYYFRERSAAGCWGPAGSAKVRINMPPSAVTVTPASAAVCLGDFTTLSASATAPAVEVFEEDFNAGTTGWTIDNISGIAASYWQGRTPPGHNNATAGDGTPYVQSAPDATGPGVTTTTILTSPSFSLVGYTAATLTFNQFFRAYTADIDVLVECSPDGGATWITLLSQGANVGASAWTPLTPTSTVALPPACIGQPNVMLRWNYNTIYGWYWTVDNVKVNATPTLTFDWAGVAGATGLSCTTCDTTIITPAVIGDNVYTVTSTVLGCTAGTSVTVTANPLPAVFNVTGGGNYCTGGAGVAIGLDGSAAGIDYQLYMGVTPIGAPVAGTGAAVSFGLQTAAGSYSVVATNTVTSCVSDMAGSATIAIDTLPAAITGMTDVCEGSMITLASSPAGGMWTSSDPAVASADTFSGDVTGVTAGVADITYTLPTTCFITQSVTVNALPVVAAITGITNLCAGNTTTLSNATAGGVWSSDDATIASIDAAGMVTAVAGGITTISYTVTDGMGCTNAATVADTVSTLGTFSMAPLSMAASLCHGNPVNLVITGGGAYTYQWSMGGVDIPGATNSSYIATAAGSYEVFVDNGVCSATLPSFTVSNQPDAIISYNTTGDYLYTGTFPGYQWYMNGTAIAGATAGILMSPAPGTYMVVVTDANGCTDTSADFVIAPTMVPGTQSVSTIRVYPNPASSVIYVDAAVPVKVAVLSPDGRTVIAGTETKSVDLSRLANGMYMLMVTDMNNTILTTERITKVN